MTKHEATQLAVKMAVKKGKTYKVVPIRKGTDYTVFRTKTLKAMKAAQVWTLYYPKPQHPTVPQRLYPDWLKAVHGINDEATRDHQPAVFGTPLTERNGIEEYSDATIRHTEQGTELIARTDRASKYFARYSNR